MGKEVKPIIVISAISFRSGGPLSILQDCVKYLKESYVDQYKIVVLVHSKDLLIDNDNVDVIEYPHAVRSYFLRLYYEYVLFRKLSKRLKPVLWLSLHDITPNVVADSRVVYCHNPAPFYKCSFRNIVHDPTFFMFTLFYKYLYQINIHDNTHVIVQQNWIKEEFEALFDINNVIVAHPEVDIQEKELEHIESNKFKFFYPTFPRVFKNIELICEAVRRLEDSNNSDFDVIITIDGTENRYSRYIVKKYQSLKSLHFIGLVEREQVFEIYAQADCLLFPSKLETWGMPLSEYSKYNRPIIAANMQYAHETLASHRKSIFVDVDNPGNLAYEMKQVMTGSATYAAIKPENYPSLHGWGELFSRLL